MTFSNQPDDFNGIPIANCYVPNNGFIAIQGSETTSTDGLGNTSTSVNINISQVDDTDIDNVFGDGMAPDGILTVIGSLKNGNGTYDEPRGNTDQITLINASNVTTTQGSPIQTNYNARGVVVVFVMIDASASPSVSLQIIGDEPVTSTDWSILVGLPITTNGTYVYRVYPGLIPIANATANDILPRTWGVSVVANNSNQATYTVCASVIL